MIDVFWGSILSGDFVELNCGDYKCCRIKRKEYMIGVESPRVNSWGPIVMFCIGGFCLSYLVAQEIRERFKI